jgi:hypothetical protein
MREREGMATACRGKRSPITAAETGPECRPTRTCHSKREDGRREWVVGGEVVKGTEEAGGEGFGGKGRRS